MGKLESRTIEENWLLDEQYKAEVMTGNMITRTLRSWSEVDALLPEWNDLLNRSRSSAIFLSWEWIQAWRNVIDDSVSPYVITVRGPDGQLLGIAPLYQASLRLFGIITYRTLRVMADVATGSEYPDWIVGRDVEGPVSAAITSELVGNASEWDLVWLTSVAGWTNVSERITQPAIDGGLQVQTRSTHFSVIKLPSEMSEFDAGFSARRRQQMRRNHRRTSKLDGVEFVRCDTAEMIPAFLDALFDLHQKRWQAVGLDGCFKRRPEEASFYREFATMAFEKGWLALYAVLEKGQFRAVQFGYVFDGNYLQLQEGYDPDFQNGVGNALRYHAVRDFIDSGLNEYDFLAGTSEHKRRWSADVRQGYDILVGSGSLKSRLVYLGGIWPTGGYLKQSGLISGW